VSALARLLRIRRDLDENGATAGATQKVLRAGAALMSFARTEEQMFGSFFRLLDPTVQADILAEHQQFEEDLSLLESLQRSAPGSPDATALTASLASRICRHIDRDARLLRRAASMS
jgi:hypothetical protein